MLSGVNNHVTNVAFVGSDGTNLLISSIETTDDVASVNVMVTDDTNYLPVSSSVKKVVTFAG